MPTEIPTPAALDPRESGKMANRWLLELVLLHDPVLVSEGVQVEAVIVPVGFAQNSMVNELLTFVRELLPEVIEFVPLKTATAPPGAMPDAVNVALAPLHIGPELLTVGTCDKQLRGLKRYFLPLPGHTVLASFAVELLAAGIPFTDELTEM